MQTYLDLDTFLNRFQIRPNGSYSFFFGSGTSVQCGVPTGSQLIWRFIRLLYCNHHKIPQEKISDLESLEVQTELQNFIEAQGIFPATASLSYSYYFEKCYPSNQDRKYFIQSLVKDVAPSIGHKCLGRLLSEGISDTIFTTNFDELIETGVQTAEPGLSCLVLSPEKRDQINELEKLNFPKIIKLHGDYRYDPLMNTSEELKSLNCKLSDFFIQNLSNRGLIVSGYSGSDESILSGLDKIVDSPDSLPHGIVWCLRHGETPNDNVKNLIERANKANKHSGFLYVDSFDELIYQLYFRKCKRNESIEKATTNLIKRKSSFSLDHSSPNDVPIILNSVGISKYPSSAFSVDAANIRWKDLRKATNYTKVVAALYKAKLYVWANNEELAKFLNELGLKNLVTNSDLREQRLKEDSSFYIGMIYDALNMFFVSKGLIRFKKGGVYDSLLPIRDNKIPQGYIAYEALEYQVTWADGSLKLLLVPSIYLKSSKSDHFKNDPIITRTVNSLKSNRYNSKIGDNLRLWRDRIFSSPKENFKIGEFSFSFESRFSIAGYAQTDKTHFYSRLKYFDEPKVLFDPNDSNKGLIHPLKGLSEFGPYEYNLSPKGSPLRLAVITSELRYGDVKQHLDSLNSPLSNNKVDEQYLISFPSFYKVFKSYLDVPVISDSSRTFLINQKDTVGLGPIEFYEILKRGIDSLSLNKHLFDVLVVYIPTEWAFFRELKNDSFYFDLHDSIKLYSAKKGLRVQFIERKSLDYPDQLRVRWWLSQALYAKGVGIPWKMTSSSANTAYIGLGYALKDGKTLLASSQIFNEKGQGLRVLLQPIKKYTKINDNPFMSKDDARILITALRESYFSTGSNFKLDRVVIHKNNFFNQDEIEGIVQALDGIPHLELLQIQEGSMWKGIRWNCEKRNGNWISKDKSKPYHMFPMQRSAAVQIDDDSLLLWTDGSVQHPELNNPKYNYFQSSRGIPSPLVIKRFYGTDPAELIIEDILKLTKMNWNSGQLYKRLPVTLQYSKVLAEMAKQSEDLMGHPYDFRHFI